MGWPEGSAKAPFPVGVQGVKQPALGGSNGGMEWPPLQDKPKALRVHTAHILQAVENAQNAIKLPPENGATTALFLALQQAGLNGKN